MPAFWIMLAAFFLVNLPFTLATSRSRLVVLAQGLTDGTAAVMVSVFALSSMGGRIISGGALDYCPAHLIAAIDFALPFVGLLLLASAFDTVPAVALAIGLIGLRFGGEGDIVPYLVTASSASPCSAPWSACSRRPSGWRWAWAICCSPSLGPAASTVYLPYAAASAFIGSGLFLISGLPKGWSRLDRQSSNPPAAAPSIRAR